LKAELSILKLKSLIAFINPMRSWCSSAKFSCLQQAFERKNGEYKIIMLRDFIVSGLEINRTMY